MTLPVLAVSWFLSLGVVTDQLDIAGKTATPVVLDRGSYNSVMQENKVSIDKDKRLATVTEVGVELTIGGVLDLFGSVETYQFMNSLTGYSPYRADYKAGVTLHVTDWISVNATHECDHPILSSVLDPVPYDYYSQETQFFLRIEGGK